MLLVVWIDAWQIQCCGDPFEVGHTVAWTLSAQPDRDWLTSALDDQVAAAITHAEDHHGQLPDDLPPTRGTVQTIRSAFGRYAAGPGTAAGATVYPVPGSAVLRKSTGADGRERESPSLRFNGYVVELRIADPP